MENRTKAATKNMAWGIISKIISLVLSFGSRTLFIYFLGKEYLGINSLYTEVLSMLSLAELGFGSAFTFAMYKPIASNDEEKIRKLISLFKKVYNTIAVVVAVMGLSLLPFLQHIVKGADSLALSDLRLYFVIFLANTVINYFVQYKTVYVNARMQSYVVTNIEMVTNFVIIVSQCVAILIFKNYLVYLLVHTSLLIASRFLISFYLNKKFPILTEAASAPLPEEDKKAIYKNVRGLVLHKFAGVAINSTDNLIISTMSGLGVIGVGLVSNYNTLINSVTAFINIVLSALTPGFGNLVASSSQKHYKEVFDEVNFYDFWIYGFCSIAFLVLIPPFITLWLGDDFLIDSAPFFLIILNVYIRGQSGVYTNARDAKGNFNLDKWVSVVEAIINLIVSIVCAKAWGLVGVYVGTIISTLFYAIAKPIKTYRFLYGESVRGYFADFLKYLVITVAAGVATYFVSTKIFALGVSIPTFLLACVVVVLIPNGAFYIIFRRTKHMEQMINRVVRIVKRV